MIHHTPVADDHAVLPHLLQLGSDCEELAVYGLQVGHHNSALLGGVRVGARGGLGHQTLQLVGQGGEGRVQGGGHRGRVLLHRLPGSLQQGQEVSPAVLHLCTGKAEFNLAKYTPNHTTWTLSLERQ